MEKENKVGAIPVGMREGGGAFANEREAGLESQSSEQRQGRPKAAKENQPPTCATSQAD